MSANNIMIKQWSFCEECKGAGCPECKGSGKTSELIPLSSLPKFQRLEYAEAQKDFIKEQREQQEEGGGNL